jgi:DNA-binding MarR family transcriptional regulator
MVSVQSYKARMKPDDEITLGVLTAVEFNDTITQRKIARSLNIALGLANAYLKRCVRKGLIKIEQIPMRRYAYYLTPRGFAEKSRLTAEYLSVSLNFFRQARSECSALFSFAKRRGWRRVALIGAGDLAEVAVLSARETGMEIAAIVDAKRAGQECAGERVLGSLRLDLKLVDVLIFTAIDQPQLQYKSVVARMRESAFPDERLLVPGFLRLRASLVGTSLPEREQTA